MEAAALRERFRERAGHTAALGVLLLITQLHCATQTANTPAPASSVTPARLVEEAAALIERESLDVARVDWSAVRAQAPRDVTTPEEAHAVIRTFGKGRVHAPYTLKDGSMLLSVARVQTPSGRDILDEALEPSVRVASEGAPGEDAARRRALEWLLERR